MTRIISYPLTPELEDSVLLFVNRLSCKQYAVQKLNPKRYKKKIVGGFKETLKSLKYIRKEK